MTVALDENPTVASIFRGLLENSDTPTSSPVAQYVLGLRLKAADSERFDSLSNAVKTRALTPDDERAIDQLLLADALLAVLQGNAAKVLKR